MSRDFGIEAPEREPERPVEQTRAVAPRDTDSREHALYTVRGSTYRLSRTELDTMYDVGRFRAVALDDLVRHRYAGYGRDLQQDLRALAAQGLVQTREVWTGPRLKTLHVLVLTRLGRETVQNHRHPESGSAGSRKTQALYSGLVKRNEIRHDAAIYRMFQAERERLERAGGRKRPTTL